MAFQTRQRDPFLDSQMQAMIEKRGRELLGAALLFLGPGPDGCPLDLQPR